MDRDEFHERLNALGLSPSQFAQMGGWSPSTVREWGARAPVPRAARVIVDLLAQRGAPPESPKGRKRR